MTKTEVTVAEVAARLLKRLEKEGVLYQHEAVDLIEAKFGDRFLRVNDAGGVSIAPDVLAAFRELTEETTVWDRSERAWRRRAKNDGPGRLAE